MRHPLGCDIVVYPMADKKHLNDPAFVVAAPAIWVEGHMFSLVVPALKVKDAYCGIAGKGVPFTMP